MALDQTQIVLHKVVRQQSDVTDASVQPKRAITFRRLAHIHLLQRPACPRQKVIFLLGGGTCVHSRGGTCLGSSLLMPSDAMTSG